MRVQSSKTAGADWWAPTRSSVGPDADCRAMRLFSCGPHVLVALCGVLDAYSSGHERQPRPGRTASPLLIVVSIDAFRYDYLARPEAAFLRTLASQGTPPDAAAHHGRLRPQFPSYTFTNHYTLVSGRRPVSHGIVANAFYDAELGEAFAPGTGDSDEGDKRWWRVEPVYITAARAGMRTASVCWPGNRVWRHERHRHVSFASEQSDMQRAAAAVDWLRADADLRMVHVYMSSVDAAGHKHGPESHALSAALRSVDAAVRLLVDGIKALGRWEATDLVLVSDHGMAALDSKCTVDIDAVAPELAPNIVWMDKERPVTSVHAHPGRERVAHAVLRRAIERHSLPLSLHWAHALPQRLHYAPGPRTGQIVLAAHAGCTLVSRNGKEPRPADGGAHGYDAAAVPEMDGVLIVRGPSFAHSATNRLLGDALSAQRALGRMHAWDNVDVYALVCRVLGIECLPHDGSGVIADQVMFPSSEDEI